jgi:hypothetical protein
MHYTKSQIVLGMVESIGIQEDLALLTRVKQTLGVDLLNETEFSDDALRCMANYVQSEAIPDPNAPGLVGHAVQAFQTHVAPHLATVGSHVAGGLHGMGASTLGNLAAAHPVAAGAAALGAGAAAALRMRSNMKMRAQQRATAGM